MKVNFNPVVLKSIPNYSKINQSQVSTPTQTSNSYTNSLVDMRSITGQSLINFHGVQSLSPQVSRLLEGEATKRIRGDYKWPEIKDINAFMISAETQTFMKVGGLAEVAVQLPDEFNKKFSDSPNNSIQIVTPLYIGEGKKSASVTRIDSKHYLYKGGDKREIELEKVSEFDVLVYSDKTKRFRKENVGVLVGESNGTKYVFLDNPRYFGITPAEDNNPLCQGPYVKNTDGVSEAERMAFFSKAVYQLMKNVKQGAISQVETPNVIIANDWHASPLTSMMRYVAPIEKEDGKIDSATYDYIKNTPVIHITHNAQYQGSDWSSADKIFRTLFEKNTDAINSKIRGYNKKGFPLAEGYGNFNSARSDLHLADRIVAVSPHYADELSTSKDLGAGLNGIHSTRRKYGTMLGIVNGYTKKLAEPNDKMISSINTNLSPTSLLKPYANMYNLEGYSIKMDNKVAAIYILNELATKAASGEKLPGFTLVQPENCKIETDKDLKNIPFIASVGRITEQKGFDYLADSIKNTLINLKPEDERPVVAILGSGDPEVIENLNKLKSEIAKTDKVASERIFVFEGFSPGLRDALGVASDFFLIPSKWEPCGLTQMEAMPKGSIPIATSTGGLVDTIKDGEDGFLTDVFYGPWSNEKLFDNGKLTGADKPKNNVIAFSNTLARALETYYNDPEKIKQMSINAMAKDFSWDVPNGPLEDYIKLMRTGSTTEQS